MGSFIGRRAKQLQIEVLKMYLKFDGYFIANAEISVKVSAAIFQPHTKYRIRYEDVLLFLRSYKKSVIITQLKKIG